MHSTAELSCKERISSSISIGNDFVVSVRTLGFFSTKCVLLFV
uniref:Eukaryotic peptide chain release factor GTP-binding subunit ERF3A-like isoform X1 n=1 Tax=Rhizophora mucronata TaxID=61149 RepID=A0A2P2LVJ8_RHIMU